ncbi:hypothetical protein C2U55_14945 [Enterobacteriaceae bacterium ENNIH3]|nr:hypothetical protein C2U55_14945 [Enterobacteriaceae bacterium ENNIH3]AUV09633.1 hypothetical protein C2U52_26950 [Enterobacteriaceae bacterium ENNIH2]PWF51262.1 hypothetical protein BHT19_0010025 [[Kluyvera] intestini]
MALRIMVADTCLSRFTNLLRCDLPCNSFPKLSMQNGQIRERKAQRQNANPLLEQNKAGSRKGTIQRI